MSGPVCLYVSGDLEVPVIGARVIKQCALASGVYDLSGTNGAKQT